ncbi:hypothetical protein HJC23_011330 [Cyclotella cryptica]|uniref:YCII-related domain-containing protein n=1 Tax=Cyclotella cryptica TaxID=29204 RepID=A0ABD3QVP3_9STRA|eukprot:CCRYP_001736-RA/>CCRYP_001736-RA protein AED:0.21 eAED:0.21 QI:129/1/1/1/1/1/2/658/146
MMSISRILNGASLVAVTSRLSLSQTTAFCPSIVSAKWMPTFGTATRLFSSPPTRYLLSYEYVPDVLEKRGPHREGHIGLAKDMIQEGLCVSGGPSFTPGDSVPSGALFIFTSKEAAEKFVAEDPYVSNGIVTGHEIAEWSVVVGSN